MKFPRRSKAHARGTVVDDHGLILESSSDSGTTVLPVISPQHVTSLQFWDNQISSGAYDGTICIRDVNYLQGLIQTHERQEGMIILGTRGGTFEAFDVREGGEPQIREKLFDSSEICNHFAIKLRGHDAIAAGWDNGVRKLKIFDMRNVMVVCENEIPTWNVSMDVGDDQLWIGADKGKVWQYDIDSLERVVNHTPDMGHVANNGWLPDAQFLEFIRSIKYTNGFLFSSDLRQIKLHEMGKKPRLIWEDEIVFSQMAFCEERSLLAVGVGYTANQIKLFHPKQENSSGHVADVPPDEL